ncbi:MAG: VOC family protein, partial [Chloroflexi bacterium]|nr:VOC family protein [Chloroflexota bacterium]
MPVQMIERAVIATADLDAGIASYQRALGLPLVARGSLPEVDIDYAFLGAGTSFIELMRPRSDQSPLHRFLAKRGGPGLYAIGLLSSDLQADVDALAAAGVRHREVTIAAVRGPRSRVVWPDPRDMQGALFQVLDHREAAPQDHPHVVQIWQCSPLVPDLALARSRYELIVKGARVEAGSSARYGYRHNTLYLGAGPHAQSFELCSPTDSSRPMGRFYQRWGPSIYMITLEVRDLAGLVRGFEARGVRYVSEPGSARIGYIHPQETPGCFIGLLEVA